jgi:hypothetical protein
MLLSFFLLIALRFETGGLLFFMLLYSTDSTVCEYPAIYGEFSRFYLLYTELF